MIAGEKNAAINGKGSYFALNASYSVDPKYAKKDRNGVAWLVLCKIARGTAVRGTRDSTKRSTHMQGAQSTRSANDDVFVTYQDAQAYPEYLIGFRLT